MLKRVLSLPAFLLITYLAVAQLTSPEEFLGYKIGTRYTPHWKIVNYFQYVSQALPKSVKLQQYGETNEHRPLYLTFISSEENISNLENIRLNNLRLANMAKDKMMPTENTPALVWLSYNVHGNESCFAHFVCIDRSEEYPDKRMVEKYGGNNRSLREPGWKRPLRKLVQLCRWRYVQSFTGCPRT
jgi:hypothetical protein